MAPDTSALGIDVSAAQTSTAELLSGLTAREQAVVASRPTRVVADYGRGLAERASRLIEARHQAHDIRLAHIARLRAGAEVASSTVRTVSGTEQDSRRVLGAGEGTR